MTLRIIPRRCPAAIPALLLLFLLTALPALSAVTLGNERPSIYLPLLRGSGRGC